MRSGVRWEFRFDYLQKQKCPLIAGSTGLEIRERLSRGWRSGANGCRWSLWTKAQIAQEEIWMVEREDPGLGPRLLHGEWVEVKESA